MDAPRKILVDSGATKAEWCVLEGGTVRDRFVTAGINFTSQSADHAGRVLQEAAARCGAGAAELHFFGAGLIGGDPAPLRAFFPGAEIECASDLLAAARAVCGKEPGIACILGTGSNSCAYDGREIVANVHPCGFILGDEGSAACLGKRFLGAFLKGQVPQEVAEDFSGRFEADYATVVREVYRSAAPARYLGSFAPYIVDWHGRNEWMTALVEENFRDFFQIFLRQYDPALPVGVVGSFGTACRAILEKVGDGIRFGRFMAAPMDGLIDYYSA